MRSWLALFTQCGAIHCGCRTSPCVACYTLSNTYCVLLQARSRVVYVINAALSSLCEPCWKAVQLLLPLHGVAAQKPAAADKARQTSQAALAATAPPVPALKAAHASATAGDGVTGMDTSSVAENSTAVGPADAALAAALSLDARLCGLDVLLSAHFKCFEGPWAKAVRCLHTSQRGTHDQVVPFPGGHHVALYQLLLLGEHAECGSLSWRTQLAAGCNLQRVTCR